MLVLYGHSFIFLGLPEPLFMQWTPLGPLGVFIFFAISGYLVAQSWARDPHVLRFLVRRVLRIFPALAVCTVLSVGLLGPALTSLPLEDYFSHQYTRGYFSNIALYITYHLPGVFANNRVPHAVNGSLWSLPVEFAMYLGLTVLGFFRFPRWGYVLIAAAFMMLIAGWALQGTEQLVVYRSDLRQAVIVGVYFWVGVVFFEFRLERFFTLSNVVIAIMVWASLSRWSNLFVMGAWIFLPLIVLAFGLSSHSWLSRLGRFDYSYGIYIYAFPVQQTVVSFWPHLPLAWYLFLCTSLTVLLAGLSWHWVERPFLQLKPFARRRTVERALSQGVQR